MESGGKVPYQEKTGWLGRGMKIAGLTGNGLALALPMPLLIRGVPMNNNYFPVGHKLPYPSTLKMIQEAYKQYDEKLLSENLELIQTRELSNTSSDESWVLASNAANESGLLNRKFAISTSFTMPPLAVLTMTTDCFKHSKACVLIIFAVSLFNGK